MVSEQRTVTVFCVLLTLLKKSVYSSYEASSDFTPFIREEITGGV